MWENDIDDFLSELIKLDRNWRRRMGYASAKKSLKKPSNGVNLEVSGSETDYDPKITIYD